MHRKELLQISRICEKARARNIKVHDYIYFKNKEYTDEIITFSIDEINRDVNIIFGYRDLALVNELRHREFHLSKLRYFNWTSVSRLFIISEVQNISGNTKIFYTPEESKKISNLLFELGAILDSEEAEDFEFLQRKHLFKNNNNIEIIDRLFPTFNKVAKMTSFDDKDDVFANDLEVDIDSLYIENETGKVLHLMLFDKTSNQILENVKVISIKDRDDVFTNFYYKAIKKYGCFKKVNVRNVFDRNLFSEINDYFDIICEFNHDLSSIDEIIENNIREEMYAKLQ